MDVATLSLLVGPEWDTGSFSFPLLMSFSLFVSVLAWLFVETKSASSLASPLFELNVSETVA